MKIRQTLKYRLYRSKCNKHLVRQIELGAHIWNHFVELTRRYYRIYGKYPGYYKLKRHLTKLKKTSKPHWYNLNSQACQNVIERLDQSYQAFFDGTQAGRPHFKKSRRYSSFTLTQSGWKLPEGRKSNRLRIGRKNYKFSLSRPVEGEIKTVTIKRDRVGGLWVCFSVIAKAEPSLPRTGDLIGLDFGLKTFLVTSDGEEYHAPEHLKASLNEMAKRQRALSRKEKGSNNRRKARKRVAKLHRRIANQRRDWHFKLARKLLAKYDTVAIEDLNLDGMKRLWGRKVSDLGYHSFVQIFRHLARKEGKEVRQIDRYFASSQMCSGCGLKSGFKLTLEDRDWVCEECGCVHNRDVNAALNILERAFSSTVGDVRGQNVRGTNHTGSPDAPVAA